MSLYFVLCSVGPITVLLCFCTDHLLCATLSFIPVARKKSSCRHRRFNAIPLKNTTFVSQFTNHVVHLVRSRWNDVPDGLTKWSVVRDVLLGASTVFIRITAWEFISYK